MRNQNLGYPRIGNLRETKKACEQYWAGKISLEQLLQQGKNLRQENWKLQHQCGVDLIPCNDFSFYDHVLDMSMMLGNIPSRYRDIFQLSGFTETDVYFAMARGYQQNGLDIPAMEMTKWFDTNYHYIVPEFSQNQAFQLFSHKAIDEFIEAKKLGFTTKPVLIGPISYLLLGKEKGSSFNRLDLLENLLPVYKTILSLMKEVGVQWIQFDEPYLITDLSESEQRAYREAYNYLHDAVPEIKIMLCTYFGDLAENTSLACHLPVKAIHIDLVRAENQLENILETFPEDKDLSLGIIDGRNIWKTDAFKVLNTIERVKQNISEDRLWIAPSCSLLHVPCDLDLEKKDLLPDGLYDKLAFAKQKLQELKSFSILSDAAMSSTAKSITFETLINNNIDFVPNLELRERIRSLKSADFERRSPFKIRKEVQQAYLNLPLYPTTTIGSFPQTPEVRANRALYRQGKISKKQYDDAIKAFTQTCVEIQEELGLDVLVHGEFERTDMVEYFGEQLDGFAFTSNGWVQSYGSRCVKPPVIYADVVRPQALTVDWAVYAQSLTKKPMKGMLTGPVTILQWSFVRIDQARSETAMQIALAIRDEVADLEQAGIRIIQIDEPAVREGLPLRIKDRTKYLDWAVKAFRLASTCVKDETQIHTHMCYAEFNDIIESVAAMDADVITIETSRSQMELLDAFADFNYPNDIGPGVYDIHSPRVPKVSEMVGLIDKAAESIPATRLWINPDCGLKTRSWVETKAALRNMVQTAKILRNQ